MRPEFIRRVMLARTRRTRTKSISYFASLREFAPTEDGRRARFRCVVALARNGNLLGTFEGIAEGSIADEARGDSGFGYDPIFIPEGLNQTFGELPTEVKNTISHRAKAIRAFAERLRRLEFGD